MLTLLQNVVNGKKSSYFLPCTPAQAVTFAETFLDGEYITYESKGKTGSDAVTVAPVIFSVMMKNSNTEEKTYANFVLPANKTENDLFAVLIGKTLNGVLVDYVSTIKQTVCEKF